MVKINKLKVKSLLKIALIPLLLFSLFSLSCSQDSIFFYISNEPEPQTPLIQGTPTSIVLANNEIFVGNRMGNGIFRYRIIGGRTEWSRIPVRMGSLGDIASDGTNIYALIFPDGDPMRSSVIRRFNPLTNLWSADISMPLYSIQTIFGVEGRIFAGAMFMGNHENFAILHLNSNTNTMAALKFNTSLLTGAITDDGGNVLLGTAGGGIFRYSGGTINTIPEQGTDNGNIAGLIAVGNSVVAVSSEGTVFYRTMAGVFETFDARVNFTGALGLWGNRTNQWRPTLLLLGIRGRGTSLNQGYREMVLDVNGNPTLTIRIPGDESLSSVRSRPRYSASIGQLPVEAILQVPDFSRGGPINYSDFLSDPEWEPPIFAATSRSGLWSYRDGTWNAEE